MLGHWNCPINSIMLGTQTFMLIMLHLFYTKNILCFLKFRINLLTIMVRFSQNKLHRITLEFLKERLNAQFLKFALYEMNIFLISKIAKYIKVSEIKCHLKLFIRHTIQAQPHFWQAKHPEIKNILYFFWIFQMHEWSETSFLSDTKRLI